MSWTTALRAVTPTMEDVADRIDKTTMFGGNGGGTANAQTCTISPAISALVKGMMIAYIPSVQSTGAATLTVNGISKSVKIYAKGALIDVRPGQLDVGKLAIFYYDGTYLVLVNPASPWLTWSPTLAGFSANPTASSYRYKIDGDQCTVCVRQNTNGTSNATNFTISAPIVAATVTDGNWGTTLVSIIDNGAAVSQAARAYILTASSTITLDKDLNSGAWTNVNGKRASFTLTYEI